MEIGRVRRLLSFILVATLLAPQVTAQQEEATSVSAGDRLRWTDVPGLEIAVLDAMLENSDWAYRSVALVRLRRYAGPEVAQRIRPRLADASWQVRCFSIREAWREGMTIDPALFEQEDDPRVIRTAVRYGVAIPEETVQSMARRLLNIRTVDALVAGIELGAASSEEQMRQLAARKLANLVQNMNPQVAAVISRRLATLLQLDRVPADIGEWRQWLTMQPRNYLIPAPAPPARDALPGSLIARADTETFIRLRDYLGVLRQRDLEIVIAIDATTSMMPMIDAVKADVDALILFLSDISSTMRLGLLAYRDHDNPGRLIEAHRLSTDLESLRNFLFGLQTPGGATYPEAVLDGVRACRQFDWTRAAEREIIVVGDAPPHDADGSALRAVLEQFVAEGFKVHAVHVPMEFPPAMLRNLPPAQAQEREQFRQNYNLTTKQVFQEIANLGGGNLVELDLAQRNALVRSVMKLTIVPEFWPYFDEFYDSYLELCR